MPSFQQLHWDQYFMRENNAFHDFWKAYLAENHCSVLYMLGRGFDPRMCTGLEALLDAGGDGKRDCLLISVDEGPNSPSDEQSELAIGNLERLNSLIVGRGALNEKNISTWSGTGLARRRIGPLSAADIFSTIDDLSAYTDVIVDISALPRSIYFSLVGKLIYLIREQQRLNSQIKLNLHIVVEENPFLDGAIIDVGVDDTPAYIPGLGSAIEREASGDALCAIMAETTSPTKFSIQVQGGEQGQIACQGHRSAIQKCNRKPSAVASRRSTNGGSSSKRISVSTASWGHCCGVRA